MARVAANDHGFGAPRQESLENVSNIDPADAEGYLRLIWERVAPVCDGRPPVVYFAPAIEWIGHLCMDAHILKTLFDPAVHQLIFVSHRPRRQINPFIAGAALRDVTTIHLDGQEAGWNVTIARMRLAHGMSVRRGDATFVFGAHAEALIEGYQQHLLRHGRRATFRLTPEETDRRERLFKARGIDVDDRLAVVHARSSHYWSSANDAGGVDSYRNASIANHVPAIDWLVRQGYYVVRIGDSGMEPCTFRHERFLDAPHASDYDPFMDIAFVSASDFMLHGGAGPACLARGFGRGMMGVNTIFCDFWPMEPGEIFLPKRYRLAHNGEPLSMQEIINIDLCSATTNAHFESVGVSLSPNTADEILGCVTERVQGPGAASPSPATVGYRSIAEDEHRMRIARYDPAPSRRCFAMWQPTASLAQAVLDSDPEFLSGELLPIEDRLRLR